MHLKLQLCVSKANFSWNFYASINMYPSKNRTLDKEEILQETQKKNLGKNKELRF